MHSFPLLLLLVGCAEPDTTRSGQGGGGDGTNDDVDTGEPAPVVEGCRAALRDPVAPRVLLANLPYTGDGDTWAVLDIDADDEVTDRGDRLTAGRAYLGRGASTPDGSLLLVAQDDGTIAVFAVDDNQQVSVVDPGWSDDTYASNVTVDPTGERAWLTNESRADVGGGVTAVVIDCGTGALRTATTADGVTVQPDGRFLPTDNAATFIPVPRAADRALLVGHLPDDTTGADAALVSVPDGEIISLIDAFSDDDDTWLSAGAIGPAGRFALIGDASAWSSRPNQVAAVAIVDGETLSALGTADVYDPTDIVISPDGDAAVVTSGFGDDIAALSVGPDHISEDGMLGRRLGITPQVPGAVVQVSRTNSPSLVLVSEVYGLRMLRGFSGAGITDGGVLSVPDGPNLGALVLQR